MSMFRLRCRIVAMLLGHFVDIFVTNRTVPDVNDLENYVYEAKGGDGTHIYHVELVSI